MHAQDRLAFIQHRVSGVLMTFDPGIEQGRELGNSELRQIFRCSSQGGMRRSLRTNALVVVSDHTKDFYLDRWEGSVLHYTGMGLRGNQDLMFGQNRTLFESKKNGVNVHLFEVFERGKYVYQGQVELAAEPYQEEQVDFEGNRRIVWMFPLEPIHTKHPSMILEDTFQKNLELRERQARRFSDDELATRISMLRKRRGTRKVVSSRFVRNEYVSELAKRRAKGKCQLCNNDAPFYDRDKRPYLEVHHIRWLSRGGEDDIGNTVALCPNCHRKMHILDLQKDKNYLYASVREGDS